MDTRPTPARTRREGIAAFPITLADGNDWGLSLPSPRLRLTVVGGVDPLGRPTETIRVATEFGYPLEISRLVDDLRSACEQPAAERQYETLIRLAAALLRRAHDIDLTEAASLLELEIDDLPRLVETVLSVVTGECLDNPVSPRKSDIDFI
jgi:hypothetical protein